MKEIKFQFLYKGLPFSGSNDGFNWHKKTYSLDELIENALSKLSDVHGSCELIAKRQFTGLKDKNGIDIYEGDILKWDEREWGEPFNELVHWDYEQFNMRNYDWCEWCEVIGNIHETPELLPK